MKTTKTNSCINLASTPKTSGTPWLIVMVAMTCLLLGQQGLFATVYLWDGGGTDNNFGTGANWNPDGAPSPGTGNDLQFAGSTRTSPNCNYTAFDDFRNWIFNSGASSFTITGNSIDFFGKIENNSVNLQTVSISSFSFNGNSELDPTAGDLTITSASIFGNGNEIHVYGTNAKTLRVGSVISGTTTSFTMETGNTVILTGASTYGGDTTIKAGSLQFDTGGSVANSTIRLGATSGTATATVSIIDSDGGTTIGSLINPRSGSSGTKTISGANTSGVNTFSGHIPLDDNITVSEAAGGTLAFTGVIDDGGGAGTFGLTKTGAGKVQIGGTTANTGLTGLTINDGTVELNKTSGVDAMVGAITVGDGTGTDTLKLLQSNEISDTSAVTVNSSGVFDMNNLGETVGSIAGSGSILEGSAQLICGQDNTSTTFSGVISGTGAFVKKGTGTMILSGTNTTSGNFFIVGGTLQYNTNQPSTFTGTNNLGETSGSVDATIAVGNPGVTVSNMIIVRSGSTGNTLTLAANNTSGAATFTGPIIMNRALSAFANSGGSLNFSNTISLGGNRLTLTGNSDTTLGAEVSGSGDVLKQGSGNLNLSASNSFVSLSTIFIDKGLVQIAANGGAGVSTGYVNLGASSAAAGTASLLIAAPSVTVSNPVDIRYFSAFPSAKNIGSTNTTGTSVFAGPIALHDSATFTAAAGGTVRFSGAIATAGGVTGSETNTATLLFSTGPGVIKNGAGTVEFGGANTYAGETYIKNGTMQYNGSGTFGNSTIRLGDDTTNSTVTINIANASGGEVSGLVNTRAGTGGTKTMAASNTSGVNTYSGSIFLDGDVTTLSQNSGATLAFTSATFDIKNHALSVTGTGNTLISSPIVNSTAGGTVSKSGTGTLTLSGTNSYTGATTVSNGKLLVHGYSGTTAITVNSGATVGGNGNIGTLSVSAGGVLSPGASVGRLTVTNLTLASTTTNVFEFDAGLATNDTVHVISSLTAGSSKILVNISNGTLPAGHYRLIDYDGSKTGTFNSTADIGSGTAAGSLRVQETVGNQVNLIVNTAPAPGNDTFTRGSATSFKISVSDLLTNDTDFDGDTVSFVDTSATTTNGAALMTFGGTVFVPSSSVNDAFTYRVSDAFGGTNTATVYLNVVSTSGQAVSIDPTTNSTLNVTFFGIPGQTYYSQRATNMATPVWVNIATNVAPTNGVFTVNDDFTVGLGGTQPTSAFYRLLAP